jgi:hypothetical protein
MIYSFISRHYHPVGFSLCGLSHHYSDVIPFSLIFQPTLWAEVGARSFELEESLTICGEVEHLSTSLYSFFSSLIFFLISFFSLADLLNYSLITNLLRTNNITTWITIIKNHYNQYLLYLTR